MANPIKRASFSLEPFESRQLLSASTTDTTTTTPAAPVEPDVVGTVYLDRNSDGVKATSEHGLRGFTVDLLDSTGSTVQSVHSDRLGRFRFGGLTDGATYTVKVEARDGFTATTDTSVPVTVAADTIARVAVGEVRDASTSTGTTTGTGDGTSTGTGDGTGDGTTPTAPVKPNIVGTVYLDRNADAKLGKREHGLSGFTVTLTDSTGATVATTTTDRIGRYRFASVADGTYTVTVTAKTGFTASGDQTATVTVADGKLARAAFGETRDASTSTGTTTGSDDSSTGTDTGTTTGDDNSDTPPPPRGGGRRGHQGPPPSDDDSTGAATASAVGAATGTTDAGSDNPDPANCPPPPSDTDSGDAGSGDSSGSTDTTTDAAGV